MPLHSTPELIYTPTPFQAAGELRLAVREGIKNLNPYISSNASEEFVVDLLYDTLMDYKGNDDLQPNLAERLEVSPDGLNLSFWISPQARWHDARPVTAEDVVFSFQLVQQQQFPGMAHLVSLVDRVEAISPQVVKFALLTKGSDAVRLLASTLHIVPAHIWDKVSDPLHETNLQQPIGSGPFRWVQYTEDKQVVLQNTQLHPYIRPRVDTLVVEIRRDEGEALQMLRDGKLDALGWAVSPQQVNDLQKQPTATAGLHWIESPGARTYTVLLNLRKTPYNTLALRQSLAQALDSRLLIDALLLGFGEPATPDLVAPALQWSQPNSAPVAFNAQLAAKRLEEAQFVDRNGDGLREDPLGGTLQIPIMCQDMPDLRKIADWVVTQWKTVGIAAKVVPCAADALLPMLMQAQFDAALYDFSLSESEMMYFGFHSSRGLVKNGHVTGLNYGGYANAQFDELTTAMLEEPDSDKREKLLLQLQTILAADLPQIPLYVPRVLNLYRDDRFTGWNTEPGIGLLNHRTIVSLQPQ